MNTQSTRRGKKFFAPTLAAILAVAMAFTLNACGGDDGNNDNGTSSPSTGSNVSSSGGALSSSDVVQGSSSSGAVSYSSEAENVSSSGANNDSSSSSSVNYCTPGGGGGSGGGSSSGQSSSSFEECVVVNQSSSSAVARQFVLDTAYAFEYDYFKIYVQTGNLPSNEFMYEPEYADMRLMNINPKDNKYAVLRESVNTLVGNFNSIYCDNGKDATGKIVDIQANMNFADVEPVTDENINFAKGLHDASKAQIRAKMDSVSNHYSKIQTNDKRQIFRYALFIKEDGVDWFEIKHVRYADCSTAGFTELCNEGNVKNLIGQKVSFFDCSNNPSRVDGQNPAATLPTFDMSIQKTNN